jgi:hypothetical protein
MVQVLYILKPTIGEVVEMGLRWFETRVRTTADLTYSALYLEGRWHSVSGKGFPETTNSCPNHRRPQLRALYSEGQRQAVYLCRVETTEHLSLILSIGRDRPYAILAPDEQNLAAVG